MYIKKLYLNNFGRFHNKEIELSQEINVVYGANETRKATIHKFIEDMLFGFFKPYVRNRIYSSDSNVSERIRDTFAHRRNKTAGDMNGQITSGRYDEIRVDPDMNIKVVDEQAGCLVDIDELSVGAIDHIYLAIRISLLEIIKEEEELPLFLDDCFVNFDRQRLENALKHICDEAVAKKKQMILFTCHEREIDVLKGCGYGFELIKTEEAV